MTLRVYITRKQVAAGAGSAACLRARCCTDGILVTGGAGRRRMNDRILDFGHARIVILRDAALPIHLAVRAGDRVAVRFDPRPRSKVSPLAGFVTTLMDDTGDCSARQFVDLRSPGAPNRLAQKDNRFAIYAPPLASAGVPDRSALEGRAAMFEMAVEFIEKIIGVGVRRE